MHRNPLFGVYGRLSGDLTIVIDHMDYVTITVTLVYMIYDLTLGRFSRGGGFDTNKRDLCIVNYRDLTHEVTPVMGDLITSNVKSPNRGYWGITLTGALL